MIQIRTEYVNTDRHVGTIITAVAISVSLYYTLNKRTCCIVVQD